MKTSTGSQWTNQDFGSSKKSSTKCSDGSYEFKNLPESNKNNYRYLLDDLP